MCVNGGIEIRFTVFDGCSFVWHVGQLVVWWTAAQYVVNAKAFAFDTYAFEVLPHEVTRFAHCGHTLSHFVLTRCFKHNEHAVVSGA